MRAKVDLPVRGVAGKVQFRGACRSSRFLDLLGLLLVLPVCWLLVGPEPAGAWTTSSLKSWDKNQSFVPGDGLTPDETHEFIVEEAIAYLKDHGSIAPTSWFASQEFLDLVKWGVAYADHTGLETSIMCYGIGETYDLDGDHHFYHSAPIYIQYKPDWWDVVSGGVTWLGIELMKASCGDLVHVGDLTASKYALQLYNRALEFWPGGTKPLDLTTLTTPLYLGFVGPATGRIHVSGWAQGTNPQLAWKIPTKNSTYDPVTRTSCGSVYKCWEECDGSGNCVTKCGNVNTCTPAKKPAWPTWVGKGGLEDKKTAAIYLGWALHLVQDSAVYYHATNLHGHYHQAFERRINKLVKENKTSLSSLLPIPELADGGKALCDTYYVCDEWGDVDGQYGCKKKRAVEHCYDLFPHHAFGDLTNFDAKDMAISCGVYAAGKNGGQYYKSPPALGTPGKNGVLEYYPHMCLDAAIKASGAVIHQFISEVSQVQLSPDSFESNNSVNTATILTVNQTSTVSHSGLTLHDLQDEDYYKLVVVAQGDLDIWIKYDISLEEMGVELSGPVSNYWPTLEKSGKRFTLKNLPAGTYVLHLTPITTSSYGLHIIPGGRTLTPDDYEENDTPATACDILKSASGGVDRDLTIDKKGDDDYYLVNVGFSVRVDVSIWFDPTQGSLELYLDGEKADKVYEESTKSKIGFVLIGQGDAVFPTYVERTLSISRCRFGSKCIIRVTGAPNRYSLAINKTVTDECLVKLPPEYPGTGMTAYAADRINNVSLILSDTVGSPATLHSPGSNGDGESGVLPAGSRAFTVESPAEEFGASQFLILGEDPAHQALYLSGPAGLEGRYLEELLPELPPYNGENFAAILELLLMVLEENREGPLWSPLGDLSAIYRFGVDQGAMPTGVVVSNLFGNPRPPADPVAPIALDPGQLELVGPTARLRVVGEVRGHRRTITLDASESFSPLTDIQLFEWDLDGDGLFDEVTEEPRVEVEYPEPTVGTVAVRVIGGGTATAMASIVALPRMHGIASSVTNTWDGDVPRLERSFPVVVDSSVEELTVSVSLIDEQDEVVVDGGDELPSPVEFGLILVLPDGEPITPEVIPPDGPVSHHKGDGVETYRVVAPVPGPWEIVLTGEELAPEDGRFLVAVCAQSELGILVDLDRPAYLQGETIHVRAEVRDGVGPLPGVELFARTEGLPVPEIGLFDDGEHGDEAPGDGIFGNFLPGGEEAGLFSVEVLALGPSRSNEFFQRSASASAEVVSPRFRLAIHEGAFLRTPEIVPGERSWLRVVLEETVGALGEAPPVEVESIVVPLDFALPRGVVVEEVLLGAHTEGRGLVPGETFLVETPGEGEENGNCREVSLLFPPDEPFLVESRGGVEILRIALGVDPEATGETECGGVSPGWAALEPCSGAEAVVLTRGVPAAVDLAPPERVELEFLCVSYFLRGDSSGNGWMDISDAIIILLHLFSDGGRPYCLAAMNTNGDGAVDLTDAIHLLRNLFLGEAAPVEPFPECGPGLLEADRELGCEDPPAGCAR